jgi:hypothetical protein
MAGKIKLMISSRCSDLIEINKDQITFTDLRIHILKELEKETFLGKPFFEVAISEYFTSSLDGTSWDKCLQEIVDSDIVIIWFTGHEGYKDPGKSIGICYAEYIEAIQSNPAKVFILDFRKLKLLYADHTVFDKKVKEESDFALEIQKRDKWLQRVELSSCKSIATLKDEVLLKCSQILFDAISNFTISGSASLRQARHSFGEGLLWNKLNYRFRQEAINFYLTKAVNKFLPQPDFIPLQKALVLHAIPDSMSIAEARELVGRPFLNDLELISGIDIGPVHIIGVYKNTTERQVRDIIGHQDVAIIQEGFGFYVWDLVNHIQLIYITNCSDPEVTLLQTQAFFTWLRLQDETKYVIDRAKRRNEILKVIYSQKIELKGTLR